MCSGVGVSKGIVKAKLCFYKELPPTYEKIIIVNTKEEQQYAKTAFSNTAKHLLNLYTMAREEVGLAVASIIQGHLLIVEDHDCQNKVLSLIQEQKVTAQWAIQEIFGSYIDRLKSVKTPYQQARTMDLKHILYLIECEVEKIKNRIHCEDHVNKQVEAWIAVGKQFSVEDILLLYHQGAVGFVDLMGEEESHTTVIAKSLNLPMIIHMDAACLELNQKYCVMNGLTGKVNAE